MSVRSRRTTLQSWARQKLAEKELANHRYANRAIPDKGSFNHSNRLQYLGTQLLVVISAAVVILGTRLLNSGVSGGEGAEEKATAMMASSPAERSMARIVLGTILSESLPTHWAQNERN